MDKKLPDNEAYLDFMYPGASDEARIKIKEKIKKVTENFLKCEVCGKSYGTLRKTKTGYAHKDCQKDIKNYLRHGIR